MQLDLRRVPFSVPGSYVAVSARAVKDRRAEALHLHTVRGRAMWNTSVLFELVSGEARSTPHADASPGLLTLTDGRGGRVEVAMPEPSVVRLRGRGMALELLGGGGLVSRVADDRWKLAPGSGTQFVLQRLGGRVTVDAPWATVHQHHKTTSITIRCEPGEDGTWEAVLDEHEGGWEPRAYEEPFDAGVRRVRAAFDAYVGGLPAVEPRYRAAAELAAYVNWSSVVRPSGLVTRPAMLMSKNWMHATWSWDNCFNAAATAAVDPQLALDQLMVVADNQHASGAFPDYVTDHHVERGFCKPAVYGWALRRMIAADPAFFASERLAPIYRAVGRSTDWWFRCRDDDGDGAPSYYHGNDCGWDNASVFDGGCPVEGPDALAFLAMQTDVLAEVATLLSLHDESSAWRARSDQIFRTLLEQFWDGRRFMFRSAVDHRPIVTDSLIHFLPLAVADRLPADVRSTMVRDLTRDGGALTPHGLATEPPTSGALIADGYWRGPIWAPPMVLIIDGLRDAGEHAVATDLARRFCDTCATAGFAENFHPLTGAPLRDPAYTWTSSAFLILARTLTTAETSRLP